MATTLKKVFVVFIGYLWYLSLYCIIFPFLVIFLGLRLDVFIFNYIFDKEPFLPFMLVPTIIGLIVVLAGIIIMVASLYYLHKKARFFPLDTLQIKDFIPQTLVVEGIYGYVRHPMLLGYLCILIGLAIMLASPMSIVWTIPLFFWAAYEYEVLIEEKRLISWFGDEFITYRNTVPFMFPFLKKKTRSKNQQ